MLTPLTILLLLYSAFVIALTAAEYRADKRAQWFFKPACALGFILIALHSGALETPYGQIILAALCLCAVGDALLLSRNSQKLFLLGMAAFALGHIAYIVSFIKLGLVAPSETITTYDYVTLIAFATILLFFSPWPILQNVPKDMKIPVIIYTVIIVAMCILSVFTWTKIVILAALLFAVSDHFVGKDRFVEHKAKYALAITPLYFGAQVLFALSVANAL